MFLDPNTLAENAELIEAIEKGSTRFVSQAIKVVSPARVDIGPKCVTTWRNYGLLRGYPVNDRDDWLYEDPGPNPPRKAQGVKLEKRRRLLENVVRSSQEVQYEA